MADEDFNMTPVVSSQIAAVGFNPTTSQGRVEFLAKGSRGGSLYEYDSVTEDEYTQIVNAPSVGTVFGTLWKNVKPYRRIS